jgi:hypothetical protein
MLVASKCWEQRPPSIEDLLYISDHTYTREQVIAMECVLLNSLKFSMCHVTPWDCQARIITQMGREFIDQTTENLCAVSLLTDTHMIFGNLFLRGCNSAHYFLCFL